VRFIVYGAGAVGGVVGAQLCRAGHDVVLIARGAHHDAIAAHGLRFRSPDEDVVVPIPVVAAPSELRFGIDDVVLLGVKSQDTFAACQALTEVAASDLPVVSLQNGVANEPMLLRFFANVFGICVMAPTSHLEPGVVHAMSTPIHGLLDIGRYPTGDDATHGWATASAVAAALSQSGFESLARPDIMRWKYTKLLMNLGNAVQAACTPDDDARELVRRARSEGVATLDAAGIAYASQEEDRARRGERLTVRPIDGAPRGGGSTWQSLARRTGTTEVDYLNGEIAWLGRRHGVATPVNAALCSLTRRLARERATPQSVPAAEVLAGLPVPPLR
jgi:2-dehydropantoate 2-reductase